MSPQGTTYGMVAELDSPDALVDAARRATAAGYTRVEAYSPLPVHGIDEALRRRRTRLPWITFVAGVTGGVLGFALQYWTSVVDYPIDVGGRPLNSWPAFIPVTFESAVLLAGIATVVGLFALNRLPTLYHPIFDAPDFERASVDRFFLCIEADDPLFDADRTRNFLESLSPLLVADVPTRA